MVFPARPSPWKCSRSVAVRAAVGRLALIERFVFRIRRRVLLGAVRIDVRRILRCTVVERRILGVFAERSEFSATFGRMAFVARRCPRDRGALFRSTGVVRAAGVVRAFASGIFLSRVFCGFGFSGGAETAFRPAEGSFDARRLRTARFLGARFGFAERGVVVKLERCEACRLVAIDTTLVSRLHIGRAERRGRIRWRRSCADFVDAIGERGSVENFLTIGIVDTRNNVFDEVGAQLRHLSRVAVLARVEARILVALLIALVLFAADAVAEPFNVTRATA